MNKAIKALLTIAVCCVLGGIVITCACVGIARANNISFTGEMREQNYSNRTYENIGTQSRELTDLHSLELALIGEPVTIQSSAEQDTVTIEWSQTYDNQYTLTESASGHVKFQRQDTISANNAGFSFDRYGIHVNFDDWLSLLDGIFWWDRKWHYDDLGSTRAVTITVPEGTELDDINIAVVSGTVDLDGIMADAIAYAGVDTRFDLRNCRADSLVIGNVDGNATIINCDIGSLDMGTVSGRLDMDSGRCEDVEIGGVDASLSITGTQGLRRANVSGLNAEASLTIPGSRDDYDISAEGLNAELTVDGEYYGRRNLTGRPGAGTLSADGLNAILRVRFE